MNPPRDICQVFWDDVEHFCQHTQFLERLCGPRYLQTTSRANRIEAYNWLSSFPNEFPEFVMHVTEKVAMLPRDQTLTWKVNTSNASNGAFYVRVTVYLK